MATVSYGGCLKGTKKSREDELQGVPQKKRVNRPGWLEAINTSEFPGLQRRTWAAYFPRGWAALLASFSFETLPTQTGVRELSKLPDPPTTVAADVILLYCDAARLSRF